MADERAAIDAVLSAHLDGDPRVRARRGPLRWAISQLAAGGGGQTEFDEQALANLRLIAGDGDGQERFARELREAADALRGLEVDGELATPVLQAYSRALTRIVDAEAEMTRAIIARAPVEERARRLEELLTLTGPVRSRTLEALHDLLLRDALDDVLRPERLDEPADVPQTVALVDVVGSTDFLASATDEATHALVDALFEAGQSATLGRPVRAVKYVGDGVFLAGRDTGTVAQAGLDAIAALERSLDRPARGGLACGPVVRRAGDLFGLAVNFSQVLTKKAQPGTLLAGGAAVDALPAAMREAPRRVSARKLGGTMRVAEVRRPAKP